MSRGRSRRPGRSASLSAIITRPSAEGRSGIIPANLPRATASEIIATLSAGMTLCAGDVIATGTPAGVGIGFKPPRFMKSGDEMKLTIGNLGTLTNRVK